MKQGIGRNFFVFTLENLGVSTLWPHCSPEENGEQALVWACNPCPPAAAAERSHIQEIPGQNKKLQKRAVATAPWWNTCLNAQALSANPGTEKQTANELKGSERMVTSDIRCQSRSESSRIQKQSHKSRFSELSAVGAHPARLGRKKANTSICRALYGCWEGSRKNALHPWCLLIKNAGDSRVSERYSVAGSSLKLDYQTGTLLKKMKFYLKIFSKNTL